MKKEKTKKKKGTIWIGMGLLLVAAALSLIIYNVMDNRRSQVSAQAASAQLARLIPETEPQGFVPEAEAEIPDYILNPDMDMPVAQIDGQDYIGELSIPCLDLSLGVISEWSYPRLRISPCRYRGSAYKDDLIIAAHNYSSHFGQLKTLSPGDWVDFTDMDGNEFHYEVALVETLEPTALEEMEAGDWDLTLFTCTIGGSYRVTVRCERVGE